MGKTVSIYYFHPDHLGTATFVSDANGEPYQFFLNLPFGELRSNREHHKKNNYECEQTMAEQRAGSWQNSFKFNGKELDQETGLYYYGARYYNPRWSSWLSVDPLADQAPSWTPYRYGFNNPVRFIDPNGMFESKADAKKWAKKEGIKTGLFRAFKIKKNSDGGYSIRNKKENISYTILDMEGLEGINFGERKDGVRREAAILPAKKKDKQRNGFNIWGIGGFDIAETPQSDNIEGVIDQVTTTNPVVDLLLDFDIYDFTARPISEFEHGDTVRMRWVRHPIISFFYVVDTIAINNHRLLDEPPKKRGVQRAKF